VPRISRLYILICFFLAGTTGFTQSKNYSNGVQAYTSGNYSYSVQLLNQFLFNPLRNHDLDGSAHYYRGLSYYEMDQFQKALEDLQVAIQTNIEDLDNAHVYIGKVYIKQRNESEAIGAFNKVIENGKDRNSISSAYYERALINEKKGDLDGAKNDLNAALEQNPNNKEAKKKLSQMPSAVPYSSGRGNQPPMQQEQKSQPVTVLPSSLAASFQGEKRYALVIGNSNYPKEIGVLKNPANDAQDIASALRRCNFNVELLLNATHRQIEIAATNLFKKLSDGPKDQTVGLFFYAGHGLQFEGVNYLVPVDASVTTPTDVVYACYPADKILGKMEFANTRMNIVILDACRSNPFPNTTRSGGPVGLAQVRAAKGSYVAFATAPGSVASDGTGRNGLYTQELLKVMLKPNLTIEQVFKEVRQHVSELSDGKQSTWDNSNIIGDFYFTIK
jgi:tetratricopeptide (TPR) repeat protein